MPHLRPCLVGSVVALSMPLFSGWVAEHLFVDTRDMTMVKPVTMHTPLSYRQISVVKAGFNIHSLV